jgi:hypothetical protein
MSTYRGGPPLPATRDKIAQVDTLTRTGWGLVEACAQVGLDVPTWYRHTPNRDVDQLDGLLDVLAALAGKAA